MANKQGGNNSGRTRGQAAKDFAKDVFNPIPGIKVFRNLLHGDLYDALKAGVSHTGKMAKDFKDMVFNHPEWYTHYNNESLVNINLAAKQFAKYAQFNYSANNTANSGTRENASYAMPSMARLRVQLTTPKGDTDGWKAGIRLLYQQLRTANSGRINFTVKDLEKYVQNVRALVAIATWLKRLYKLTYTFRSTNSNIPRGLIQLNGINFDDIMKNAAPLFAYVQRYIEQINVTFPLDLDYFKRAQWMFGNVFADSDSGKPALYEFVFESSYSLAQAGDTQIPTNSGIYYYTSAITSGGTTWQQNFVNIGAMYGAQTYAELTAQADQIKAALIDDSIMSIIAGDIIKAFGDRAFRHQEAPAINEDVAFIYDSYALAQIQNADVIHLGEPEFNNIDNGETNNNNAIYTETIGTDGWITPNLELSGWLKATDFSTSLRQPVKFDTAQQQDESILNRYNKRMYNWHKDEITPGELMSINRLVVSGAEKLRDGDGTTTGGDADFRIRFNIFGTEVVTGFEAMVYATNQRSGDIPFDEWGPIDSTPRVVCVGGYICNRFNGEDVDDVTPRAFLILARMMWLWTNLDWAPRFTVVHVTYSTTTGSSLYGIAQETLDWDVFAIADTINVGLYYSYANQSMLYAGSSQNQSNSKVYNKSKTKNPKGKKKERGEVKEPKTDPGEVQKSEK